MVGSLEGLFLCGSGFEIYDNLGVFCHDTRESVQGFIGFRDNFGDHEGSQHAVAGGFAGKDNVARLFATNFDILLAHSGGNVGIADSGNFGFDVIISGPIEEALVSHDGDGDFI